MAKSGVEFRDAIPWDGLECGTSLRIPERLLHHLVESEINDPERLVVLRLFCLLQAAKADAEISEYIHWGKDHPSSPLNKWLDSACDPKMSLYPIY